MLFNVFELGLAAKLDDSLSALTSFEAFKRNGLKTELEVSGLNLLFTIQVKMFDLAGRRTRDLFQFLKYSPNLALVTSFASAHSVYLTLSVFHGAQPCNL